MTPSCSNSQKTLVRAAFSSTRATLGSLPGQFSRRSPRKGSVHRIVMRAAPRRAVRGARRTVRSARPRASLTAGCGAAGSHGTTNPAPAAQPRTVRRRQPRARPRHPLLNLARCAAANLAPALSRRARHGAGSYMRCELDGWVRRCRLAPNQHRGTSCPTSHRAPPPTERPTARPATGHVSGCAPSPRARHGAGSFMRCELDGWVRCHRLARNHQPGARCPTPHCAPLPPTERRHPPRVRPRHPPPPRRRLHSESGPGCVGR